MRMGLKSSRKPTSPKSSPAQQMKAFIKASPIKLRKPKTKPPSKGASSAASPAKSQSNDMPKLTQEASAIKLNQLRSKYGIKPISIRKEKTEKPAVKEVDKGERETVKEVDNVEQEIVKEEQPSFIDTEKMWMSVEVMTRKSAAAINPVWEKFAGGGGGGESPLTQQATAEEKGLAVIAAFANYKALQAKAEQKALAVEVGRKFCNESTSVKQMKTRSARQQVLMGEFEKAQKEKFAAKSTVMSMWSSLTSAERKAVGGLGEIEQDLFEGIESNVFSKLGKISEDFVCPGTSASSIQDMAKAFVYGAADDKAAQKASTPPSNEVNDSDRSDDKSPVVDNTTQNVDAGSVHSEKSLRDDKVEETENDDTTQKATDDDGSLLSQRVNSLLIDPLLAKLQEKDDATQETSGSNKSSLAKLGLDTLLFGDQDDDTVLSGKTAETSATENTAESGTTGTGTTDPASVRRGISLLGRIEETIICGGGDHATILTEERTFASGNTDGTSNTSLLEKLNETMMCVGSDDTTTVTGGTFENSLCTEEEIEHNGNDDKVNYQPEESLASEKIKRTTSTKSAMTSGSAASIGTMKQSLSAAPSVARSMAVDDTKSVGSTKSAISKCTGSKSVGDTSLDAKSVASIKSVGTAETTETSKTTETIKSIESTESTGTTVASHEDEDLSQASDASTVFVYHSTIGEAFSCQKWLQLFSREDESGSSYGSETSGFPSVALLKDDDADDDASLMTHISKKPEVVYQNAPGEIEVHRRNSKEIEPVAFEDDVPMMAHSDKERYEQEIVSQRNFITHAFIKCDDFFSGLFCCQESVETTLQKSEVEEWNECYRHCKKFLRQEDDDFVDEEAFTAWLNMQEALATKTENGLSAHRVSIISLIRQGEVS